MYVCVCVCVYTYKFEKYNQNQQCLVIISSLPMRSSDRGASIWWASILYNVV